MFLETVILHDQFNALLFGIQLFSSQLLVAESFNVSLSLVDFDHFLLEVGYILVKIVNKAAVGVLKLFNEPLEVSSLFTLVYNILK